MHYRIRKAVKKGHKWSSVYCEYRFKSMPKIGDKEFDDFVQIWGDGSYIILDDKSKYIGSIKIDKFGYRRRANKRGQIIKSSKFPSKHQRNPECADCYKKGFISGVKKTRERANKVIQKRNAEIIQLKKQLKNMSRSQSVHTPIQSQMKVRNQISNKKENKLSNQIVEKGNDRDNFKEVNDEDVQSYECPSCGTKVTDQDIQCPTCGFDPEEEDDEYEEKTIETYECPSCGTKVRDQDIQCLTCGFDPEEEDEDVIDCPKCETPLEGVPTDDRYYCPNCRNEYLIFYVCPSCDLEVTPGATQCPKCGKVFEEEEVLRMVPICTIHKTPMAFSGEDGFFCLLCQGESGRE